MERWKVVSGDDRVSRMQVGAWPCKGPRWTGRDGETTAIEQHMRQGPTIVIKPSTTVPCASPGPAPSQTHMARRRCDRSAA